MMYDAGLKFKHESHSMDIDDHCMDFVIRYILACLVDI